MFVLTLLLRSAFIKVSPEILLVSPPEEFAMLFRLGSSKSPNSLAIETVSHGDSGGDEFVCCGFFTCKLFWKTLQTTHSFYKSKHQDKKFISQTTKPNKHVMWWIYMGFSSWWVIFFFFLLKWDPFKKIINLGMSCEFGTTSYAQIVPIRHDFCHVILKSCQLSTTSATS